MNRVRHLLNLVLAAALIVGQWAGQLHALSHAAHDLARAAHAKAGGSNPPAPLDHSRDHCLAFHALECAVGAPPLPLLQSLAAVAPDSNLRLPLRPAERTPYLSRAPPTLHEQA